MVGEKVISKRLSCISIGDGMSRSKSWSSSFHPYLVFLRADFIVDKQAFILDLAVTADFLFSRAGSWNGFLTCGFDGTCINYSGRTSYKRCLSD